VDGIPKERHIGPVLQVVVPNVVRQRVVLHLFLGDLVLKRSLHIFCSKAKCRADRAVLNLASLFGNLDLGQNLPRSAGAGNHGRARKRIVEYPSAVVFCQIGWMGERSRRHLSKGKSGRISFAPHAKLGLTDWRFCCPIRTIDINDGHG
jgi:hypothetical protein